MEGLNAQNNSIILWKNNKPSSPLSCRPIKFSKETKEIIKEEKLFLKPCIENIRNFNTEMFEVQSNIQLTTIGGKVSSAILETDSVHTS